MSRRPASDVTVPITVNGVPFKLAQSTLDHLPSAQAFIGHLLGRGVSAHIASEYARLAAKVIREGRSAYPELIAVHSQRTAINAYWAWIETAYANRTREVLRVLASLEARQGVEWIRVGSLVPPRPGKQIPQLIKMPTMVMDAETRTVSSTPAEVGWRDTVAWTLHVPHSAVPVHVDPCADCTPIELTDQQVRAIAAAFEDAYGHRDLARVPPEFPLFGTPPRKAEVRHAELVAAGRVAGLLPAGVLADTIKTLHGHTTRDREAFLARLGEGVDTVVISSDLVGDDPAPILKALETLWAKRQP